MQISNQPNKGEVYFGIRLYKDGKYIGSHNGHRKILRVQWFTKCFIDMFIDDLREVSEKLGVTLKLDEKIINN